MKNDEITICECCEYLSTMIDDEECLECIEYIKKKAKQMHEKLTFYKEKNLNNLEMFILHSILNNGIE